MTRNRFAAFHRQNPNPNFFFQRSRRNVDVKNAVAPFPLAAFPSIFANPQNLLLPSRFNGERLRRRAFSRRRVRRSVANFRANVLLSVDDVLLLDAAGLYRTADLRRAAENALRLSDLFRPGAAFDGSDRTAAPNLASVIGKVCVLYADSVRFDSKNEVNADATQKMNRRSNAVFYKKSKNNDKNGEKG